MSRDRLAGLLFLAVVAVAGVAPASDAPPAPPTVAVVATEVTVKPLTSERVFSPPRRLGERPYVVTVLLLETASGDVRASRPLVLFTGERERETLVVWGHTVAIAASVDREGRKAEVEVSAGKAGSGRFEQRFVAWLPAAAEGSGGRPPGVRPAAPDTAATPPGQRGPTP